MMMKSDLNLKDNKLCLNNIFDTLLCAIDKHFSLSCNYLEGELKL